MKDKTKIPAIMLSHNSNRYAGKNTQNKPVKHTGNVPVEERITARAYATK